MHPLLARVKLELLEAGLTEVRAFNAHLDEVEARLDTIQDRINQARLSFAPSPKEAISGQLPHQQFH